MPIERHLLFGIIAYQNRLISREQLLAAVDRWLGDKTQSIPQVLIHDQVLSAAEVELLDDLLGKLLLKQGSELAVGSAIIADFDALLAELRNRDDEDIYNTIGPAPPPTAESQLPCSTPGASTGSRFQLLRFHDEGGLGRVSIALDTELDREVALKEIKPQYADDQASRSRFLLEAEITGGLEHPGIVPIYGLGAAADGRPYYAMRFIKGHNLATTTQKFHQQLQAGATDADRAVGLRRLLGRFLDVCNAVYFAHQRGILHRDLKPGNVMLGEYGETLVVDWGLAKSIDQGATRVPTDSAQLSAVTPLRPRSGSSLDATQLGSAIGSPHYMSPEQARGEHDRLGPATDVYSLGATLYTVLTNRKPVEGETLEEIFEKVHFGNRRTAREQNPRIDISLSAVCERAMALEPAERYTSVRELSDDVERYLADETVTAYAEPWSRRTQRWLRKHPRMVGSIAATLVAGIVSAVSIAGVVNSSNRQLGELNASLKQSRNEAIQAKEQAETVSEFMVGTFRLPDPAFDGRTLTVLEVLDRAVDNLGTGFESDPLTKAALVNALGQTYLGLGLPQKTVALFQEALKLRQQHLATNHLDTLLSMNNLAASYLVSGQTDKALTLQQETTQLMRESLGADHLETLTSMNNLATSFRTVGQPEKAYLLNKETLELRRESLGSNHPDTLLSMNNLALSLYDRGQYDDAIARYEQTLKLMRKHLGQDHPLTLNSMSNLAESFAAAGQIDMALALHQEALQLRVEKLGSDHPDTLMSMNNLAQSYSAAGQADKALRLHEETLELMRENLGAVHPFTLSSMNNLGASYFASGQTKKALEQHTETLELMRTHLGRDHPNTLTSMNNLADCYSAVGQADKALSLNNETLELRREKLGRDHPDTLMSMNNLAASFFATGQSEKSLALHGETLKLRCELLGFDHPETLRSMNNLAHSCAAAGQIDKALALYEETLELRREKLGANHPDTLFTVNDLAYLRERTGGYDRAESLYRTYSQALRDNKSAKNPFGWLIATEREVYCRIKQAKYLKAEELLNVILQIETHMPDWFLCQDATSLLGAVKQAQGKYEVAEPLLLAGYEGLKAQQDSIPKPYSFMLPEARQRIIDFYEAWDKPEEAASWRATTVE